MNKTNRSMLFLFVNKKKKTEIILEMIGDVIYKNHIYFLKHPGHLLNFWTLRVATGVDLQIFLRMGCIKESHS